jgi:hypothetical protein
MGDRTEAMGPVITWEAPSGATLDVCLSCEGRLEKAKAWPKDSQGEEFCTVSHGVHPGRCQVEGCLSAYADDDVDEN